ncbi:MAG: prepilin-type N-terminal cleavage/methylation domain-containing protein [Rubrivivax sp.]
MPTSARGSSGRRRLGGFTLIELMVVMAVIAIATGLIALSIRDPAGTKLENEAVRLAALLEGARTEARAGGLPVVWLPSSENPDENFRFVGLPAPLVPSTRWLDERVTAQVIGAKSVVLGPEAILPAQRIVLRLEDQRIDVGSDGLAAFSILPLENGP